MEQFLSVDIGRVAPSATNPRKHFDKKDMADLTDSIKSKGIINPILVRPFGKGYEIVAGERRYRAAQEAKLDMIPVIVKNLDDEQALEVQVIENLQRSDVHPLDEAGGYKQLMERNKYDQQAIADKVGKSIVYVYQRLQLLQLIDPIKKLFWDDSITVTHAIHIARLSPENQEIVLKEIKDDLKWRGGPPSLKSLTDFINRHIFLDLNKTLWKKDDAELDPKAGACSACAKRTGFNKSLFPDMAKTDMCLDKSCFDKKTQLHIEDKIHKTEEAQGVTLVRVSDSYYPDDKSLLGKSKYDEMKKADAASGKARMAIVAEGSNLGKIIYIRTASDQKPEGGGLSESEKLSRAKKRVENQKREIDRKYRIALLKAVRDKINTKLTTEDLRDIAAQLLRSIDGSEYGLLRDELKQFANKDINRYRPGVEEMRKLLPVSEFELAKHLMMFALASTAVIGEYNTPSVQSLHAAADRYGIDHKALKEQVQKDNPIKMPKILIEKKEAKKPNQKKTKKPAKK